MNFLNSFKKIKNNTFKTVNIFYLTIILIIFFLDRYTKSQIINNLNNNAYFFNDYINFY